jgi:electron transfer flavoprotein beta subunit
MNKDSRPGWRASAVAAGKSPITNLKSTEVSLKIVVCIKQVPDSEAKVVAQDERPSWGESALVINPFDEYAVEGALRQKDALNASVTAVCIGPETAREALKHALAMGADEALLLCDPAFEQLDTQGAARVLAAAVRRIGEVDLLVFGRQTLDNGAGLTPAQTARLLGWPMLSLAGSIKVAGTQVTVERVIEEGRQTVSAGLPVVISVVQSIGEPRYPSFMGIRKASKAEIPAWMLADLGIPIPTALVQRTALLGPPARGSACEIIAGEGADEIADKLADKILAEKVL